MKQIYVLIFLLSANYIFFHVAQSQSVIIQYDNAGNRILRKQNIPLPVTLISFTAIKVSGDLEGYTALLNWQTSAEINSDALILSVARMEKNGLISELLKQTVTKLPIVTIHS